MALHERRYLVTGAASGIGRAAAVLISRLRARLACLDVNKSGLEETITLLEGSGHIAREYDLHDLAGIPALLDQICGSIGKLHGLVHAAGIPGTMPLKALTLEGLREIFLVNAEAAVFLAKAFQSKNVFAGTNGSIVFITSVMGIVGDKCNVAYSMSKGALNSATRSMALELAPKGIRVNSIAPAFVRTPMFERAEKMWTIEQRSMVEALHPLGIGTPEDIANAVAFLLADSSGWITGSILVADGGYTAK